LIEAVSTLPRENERRTRDVTDKVYALGMQYFLFQDHSNEQQYAEKVNDMLLKWAKVNTAGPLGIFSD